MDIQTTDFDGAKKSLWIYPDFLSNLELPKEKQAAIEILPLAPAEVRARDREHILSAKKLSNQQIVRQALKNEDKNRERALIENVIGVRNWFLLDETGARKELPTFAEVRAALSKVRAIAGQVVRLENWIYAAIRGEAELDPELLGESESPPASP